MYWPPRLILSLSRVVVGLDIVVIAPEAGSSSLSIPPIKELTLSAACWSLSNPYLTGSSVGLPLKQNRFLKIERYILRGFFRISGSSELTSLQ